jgi:energy-coupling factor transporter ATP-binding protein EcfA2
MRLSLTHRAPFQATRTAVFDGLAILITGDPGVGKSTLARRLEARLGPLLIEWMGGPQGGVDSPVMRLIERRGGAVIVAGFISDTPYIREFFGTDPLHIHLRRPGGLLVDSTRALTLNLVASHSPEQLERQALDGLRAFGLLEAVHG